MPPTPDARQHRRVPLGFQVKLVAEDRIIAFPTARNVSLGGILLDGPEGLEVGTPCGVAILLVNGEPGKRVVARGTVVRADAHGMAIAFTKALDPESARSLQLLLRTLPASQHEAEDFLDEGSDSEGPA